jgi:hypothetical protein
MLCRFPIFEMASSKNSGFDIAMVLEIQRAFGFFEGPALDCMGLDHGWVLSLLHRTYQIQKFRTSSSSSRVCLIISIRVSTASTAAFFV